MTTSAPVMKPRLRPERGKIGVETLVKTGVPIKLARQIIYKRQYAYVKRKTIQKPKNIPVKIPMAGIQKKTRQNTLSKYLEPTKL